MNLYAKKMKDSYGTINIVIYEHGNIAKPICILTNQEAVDFHGSLNNEIFRHDFK